MTDEQINRRIAEVCGIRKFNRFDNEGWMYKTSEGWQTDCPNYTQDLNAMHEVEKMMNGLNYNAFCDTLLDIVANSPDHLWEVITATARQRAEAFLRTLGKWEEER